jgi:hypothetical protein
MQKGKISQQTDNKKLPVQDKKGVLNTINSSPIENITEEINKAISNTINNTNSYSNPIYWLLLNYINLQCLFKMNRQEDCLVIIKKQLQSAKELNEFYFMIRFKEIEIMIYLYNYNLAEANKIISEISEASRINNLVILFLILI